MSARACCCAVAAGVQAPRRTPPRPAGTRVTRACAVVVLLRRGRRWFEKQDALKVRRRPGELPDFYNITLERPRDDPAGYDVLFVDAAPAGSFASRLSHSCTPNCQAVIMSAGGRLTVAIFTLRWIAPGEELTFDYSSVTESDAEYRAAICLCGTGGCRGSFLYWAGSTVFQQARTHISNPKLKLKLKRGVFAGDGDAAHVPGPRGAHLPRGDGAGADAGGRDAP